MKRIEFKNGSTLDFVGPEHYGAKYKGAIFTFVDLERDLERLFRPAPVYAPRYVRCEKCGQLVEDKAARYSPP